MCYSFPNYTTPYYAAHSYGGSALQIRNQYLVSTAFVVAFLVTISIIGFGALVAFPNIESREVLPHIIKTLLPIGFKGLAISGLFAIIFSTADAHLHAAGFCFAYDVVRPLSNRFKRIDTIFVSRVATFFIGAIAVLYCMRLES